MDRVKLILISNKFKLNSFFFNHPEARAAEAHSVSSSQASGKLHTYAD